MNCTFFYISDHIRKGWVHGFKEMKLCDPYDVVRNYHKVIDPSFNKSNVSLPSFY